MNLPSRLAIRRKKMLNQSLLFQGKNLRERISVRRNNFCRDSSHVLRSLL